MAAATTLTSFYSCHPHIKNRAENDEEFNQCVDNNLKAIDKLFSGVSLSTHKLLNPNFINWGKKVVLNPVLIIVTTSMSSGLVLHGIQKTSAYDADDDTYNERVKDLAAKIETSLDRILSRCTTQKLQLHLSLVTKGVAVVICDQYAAMYVAKKNFNVEPNQIKPDMVGLSHAELFFE